MLKTDLLSVFMHTQFCQGHRVHTMAALTMSKLQERQPLREAPSACAVFPSFIAPMLSVKSSTISCLGFQEGCEEKHLEFPGIEPLGTWDLRGVGGSPLEQSGLLFLPPECPALTRELLCHILGTSGQRIWTGTNPPMPLGKQ